MLDPVSTLLADVTRALGEVPGVALGDPLDAAVDRRAQTQLGGPLSPGAHAFYNVHDGGRLGEGVRILPLAEALLARDQLARREALRGLLPVIERDDAVLALDPDAAVGDEWCVVEIHPDRLERRGTSFLRYLHVLAAELTSESPPETGARISGKDLLARARAVAQLRCERDPFLATHWVEAAELADRAGAIDEATQTLEAGLRTATPPTSDLLAALALRRLARGERGVMPLVEDALEAEALTARDDDARLDAAALLLLLSVEGGDEASATRARTRLGDALASTASFFRLDVASALALGDLDRAHLAARLLAALLPEDRDAARLRRAIDDDPRMLTALWAAREALDAGKFDAAEREIRAAIARKPEVGLAHAILAETLNAARKPGALDAAQKALDLNPRLIEGWRELAEAHLESGALTASEKAWRTALEHDPAYGLAHAKLAQVLFEGRRHIEALESLDAAADRGADPFFVAALRGDLYAEMRRHEDAAEAYDHALEHAPDDHWTLHQAAIEHSRSDHHARASQLFELAIKHDTDGCAQTFVDYGDLLRRRGRIGDAVRMYRQAVKAMPRDAEWREMLREAEKELAGAPN